MSSFIKLNRYINQLGGTRTVRVNVDQIQYYYLDEQVVNLETVDCTMVSFENAVFNVTELPDEIDEMLMDNYYDEGIYP